MGSIGSGKSTAAKLLVRLQKHQKGQILINDVVSNSSNRKTYAYLHFHPNVKLILINENTVMVGKGISKISFIGDGIKIKKENYDFALGFNNVVISTKLKITFNSTFKTKIIF